MVNSLDTIQKEAWAAFYATLCSLTVVRNTLNAKGDKETVHAVAWKPSCLHLAFV